MVPTKPRNFLNREEIKSISGFISEDDYLKAACTHRTADGSQDTVLVDLDGNCHCMICKEDFKLVADKFTISEIKEKCKDLIDVIQSIKFMILHDSSTKEIEEWKEFFKIIPLLKAVPGIYQEKRAEFEVIEKDIYNPSDFELDRIIKRFLKTSEEEISSKE